MPTTYLVRHPLVKLARLAVHTYIYEHRIMSTPYPLSAEQQIQSGAFVSLLMKDQLRGSVGTLRPTQPNLATEVIVNAVAAAVRDPRFTPLKPAELLDVSFVIDLVTDLEPLDALETQDPQQHGLALIAPHTSGVVLPHLASIETPEQQLELARRKAWLAEAEPYQLLRFCVQRLS